MLTPPDHRYNQMKPLFNLEIKKNLIKNKYFLSVLFTDKFPILKEM